MHNITLSIALSAIFKSLVFFFPMNVSSPENIDVKKMASSDLTTIFPGNKSFNLSSGNSNRNKSFFLNEFPTGTLSNNSSFFEMAPDWQPGNTVVINDTLYRIQYVINSGDINGDGIDDLALQAKVEQFIIEGYNNVIGLIYFGSAIGLNETQDQLILLDDNYPWFEIINKVGDINGDGYDDMMFGPKKLYYGSATGFNPEPYVFDFSWDNGDRISHAAQGFEGGDVNNDGFDDIIIADKVSNFTFMIFGTAGNPGSQPDWIAPVPQDFGDEQNYVTLTAGDINNDGYGDIYLTGETAKAYLFLGSPTGPGQVPAWESVKKESYGYMGYYIKTLAGDFTGDGFSDILVHEIIPEQNSDSYQTMVYLYEGTPQGLSSDSGLIFNEFVVSYQFPINPVSYISYLGDMNLDGKDDFAYGTKIIFGYDIGNEEFLKPDEYYADLHSIRGIGDLNDDGIPELYGGKWQQPPGIFYSNMPSISCQNVVELCNLGIDADYSIPVLETSGRINSITYRLSQQIPGRFDYGTGNDASGRFRNNTKIYWEIESTLGGIQRCTTLVIIKEAVPTGVAIKAGYAHATGDPNTFYIGYGATDFRIEALPAGGGGPYTYLWSNGSTEKNPRISETVPGEYPYWVNMTNSNGCTSSDSTIIKVENALCSSPLVDAVMSQYPMILQNPVLANLIKSNSKIAVCKDGQTMCFTKAVVDVRITRPGYSIGACTPGVIPAEAFMTDEMENILRGELKVIVAPNPSSQSFQINVVSIYNEPVMIRIMDLAGRQVEVLNNASANQTITVGHKLRAGTYIAEVISGKERKVVKLVKMN